eukprot:13069745-Alexandrium_andersonii.AAC.1
MPSTATATMPSTPCVPPFELEDMPQFSFMDCRVSMWVWTGFEWMGLGCNWRAVGWYVEGTPKTGA